MAAFAGDPANLSLRAAGLSTGIRASAKRWVTDSPMGEAQVAFTGPVDAGILDHDVTLPDGPIVHNSPPCWRSRASAVLRGRSRGRRV
ncbi:MAG: hypothetical protein QM604_05330 [Microbacterium sp.]